MLLSQLPKASSFSTPQFIHSLVLLPYFVARCVSVHLGYVEQYQVVTAAVPSGVPFVVHEHAPNNTVLPVRLIVEHAVAHLLETAESSNATLLLDAH